MAEVLLGTRKKVQQGRLRTWSWCSSTSRTQGRGGRRLVGEVLADGQGDDGNKGQLLNLTGSLAVGWVKKLSN